jgi:hypothetical protein
MKEQVSVKDKIKNMINVVIAPENYVLVCSDCCNHLIMDQRLLVKRDELERLKRLDENVKLKIKECDNKIKESILAGHAPLFAGEAYLLKQILESLDK